MIGDIASVVGVDDSPVGGDQEVGRDSVKAAADHEARLKRIVDRPECRNHLAKIKHAGQCLPPGEGDEVAPIELSLRISDDGEGGTPALADVLADVIYSRLKYGDRREPPLVRRILMHHAGDAEVAERAGGEAKEGEKEPLTTIVMEPNRIAEAVLHLKIGRLVTRLQSVCTHHRFLEGGRSLAPTALADAQMQLTGNNLESDSA